MRHIPAGAIVAALVVLTVLVWLVTKKGENTDLEPSAPTAQAEQPNASCTQSCGTCKSRDYDARCTDRCKFNLKPYCD
jgi:hypothetical protein